MYVNYLKLMCPIILKVGLPFLCFLKFVEYSKPSWCIFPLRIFLNLCCLSLTIKSKRQEYNEIHLFSSEELRDKVKTEINHNTFHLYLQFSAYSQTWIVPWFTISWFQYCKCIHFLGWKLFYPLERKKSEMPRINNGFWSLFFLDPLLFCFSCIGVDALFKHLLFLHWLLEGLTICILTITGRIAY